MNARRPPFFAVCRLLVCCSVSLAFTALASAQSRTWTDSTGKHKTQADFVSVDDGVVTIKKANGQTVSLPVKKLSGADQRWIFRKQREMQKSQSASDDASDLTGAAPNSRRSSSANSTDWYRWRGPDGNGVSRETGLLSEWPAEGPPLLWSTRDFGRGYSSVVIHDGDLFTMGKRGGQTHMICCSATDGSNKWEAAMGSGGDPTATPTVDPESGLVYGLTNDGLLASFRCASGEEVWRQHFTQDLGGKMMSQWGYSESPLIDGDVLVCTPGGERGVMMGLNKRTGQPIWSTPMPDASAGYSSPVISHGGGVKQYITLAGNGLISVRASDGKALWHYPRISNPTANVPTPIIAGDFVLGSSGYSAGGSGLLKLSSAGRQTVRFQEIYYRSNNEMQNHHGGMVMIGNHVYLGHGHNNGLPMCVDLRTGRAAWGPLRGAGSGSAAITAADGHLYFRYENSVMALIEATPQSYRLKGSFRIKSDNGKSWPHPVICNKRLYLRDQDELHCYNIAAE